MCRTLSLLLLLALPLTGGASRSAGDERMKTSVMWADGRTGEFASDDELKKHLLLMLRPLYPVEARARHITGSGSYEMRIDRSGAVRGVVIRKSTGSSILDDAAVDALIRWRFKPREIQRITIPVRFVMAPARRR